MRGLLAFSLVLAVAGCGKSKTQSAAPTMVGPDATPKIESVSQWLYQNDVKIPVGNGWWSFDPDKVQNLRLGAIVRGPGEKSYTAAIAFAADTGTRTISVEGELQYRKSEAEEGLLIYEGFKATAVR